MESIVKGGGAMVCHLSEVPYLCNLPLSVYLSLCCVVTRLPTMNRFAVVSNILPHVGLYR